jgi:hypothetical protein
MQTFEGKSVTFALTEEKEKCEGLKLVKRQLFLKASK